MTKDLECRDSEDSKTEGVCNGIKGSQPSLLNVNTNRTSVG